MGPSTASSSGFDIETSALVSKSLSQWSSTRECSYTADTLKFLLGTMLGGEQQVARGKIQPAMESYLDAVTLQKFGPLRAGCIVSVPLLHDFPFDVPTYGGPQTGYLTVDGTTKGAEIYLNGHRKGNIVTTFALSPGDYRIQTMKCDDTVTIRPGESKKLYCEKD